MKTSVLALDLATATGWAWHRQGMPRPYFDTLNLPASKGEIGRPAAALEDALRRLYVMARDDGYPITHYFFEAQHIAGNQRMNIDTAYRLMGLGAIVEKFAWQTRQKDSDPARCYKVYISEWRKHFIGRGAGFKRDKTVKGKPYLPGEDPKILALEKCQSYGWFPETLDAAEACGILDFGLSILGEKYHPRPWTKA